MALYLLHGPPGFANLTARSNKRAHPHGHDKCFPPQRPLGSGEFGIPLRKLFDVLGEEGGAGMFLPMGFTNFAIFALTGHSQQPSVVRHRCVMGGKEGGNRIVAFIHGGVGTIQAIAVILPLISRMIVF